MTTPTHPQQVAKSASAKKMLMSDLMQTVGILPILNPDCGGIWLYRP
jgi:ribose transport system permease protein